MGAAMTKRPWDHGGRTRQQRGYGAAHDRMRRHLMETVVLCEHCLAKGRTTVGTHADHIIPLAKGGTSDRDNYQLLCRPCHGLKSLKDRGGTARPKLKFAADGWPIEEGNEDHD
ncbi:HNH endonuclease signature motif containing protein [Erythrobacter litoralis]|uniref:HNH endonuclease n=2 Tax=Erythrobacter litoralis TaxID=39960 RepID=UPI0009E04BD4